MCIALQYFVYLKFQFQNNLEYDGSVGIKVLHSFKFSTILNFKERGNITIQSLRLGQAQVQQNTLTSEDKQELKVTYFYGHNS